MVSYFVADTIFELWKTVQVCIFGTSMTQTNKRDFGSFHSSNVQELLQIPEVKPTSDH